jgi:hypothetical protein
MLIFLLFAVLFAAKLAAVAIVYHFGPLAAIPVVGICLAIAHIIEPTAAKPQRQERR